MIRQIVGVLVAAAAMLYLVNQVRRPTRWVGRFFLWTMNRSHSGLTDWGLQHVRVGKDFTILDVGCGGGRTIRKLATVASEGAVFGVDYSQGSVEAARAHNAPLIRAGRVEIRQASVSRLPFPDATFDLVTAVETHYYWPDLPNDLREVLRVVKPGGTVIVIAESYKGSAHDAAQGLAMKLLRAAHMNVEEHRRWFTSAGCSDVEAFEERGNGWLCVTGRKPSAAPNATPSERE